MGEASIAEQFGQWVQLLYMLRHDFDDDNDRNAQQHAPDAPQPAPKQQKDEYRRRIHVAIRPVIQVVTKVPTTVAIDIDAPATSSATPNDSNCMKAAIPAAMAVIPGPR